MGRVEQKLTLFAPSYQVLDANDQIDVIDNSVDNTDNNVPDTNQNVTHVYARPLPKTRRGRTIRPPKKYWN